MTITEKEHSTSSSEHNTEHHHLPFHHHQHRSHRLLHLIHPSGKQIHIVRHPREIETKRHELARDTKVISSHENFDVVVYGTPEHLSCVRDIQQHHLTKREQLRQKNAALFEEFDQVHETLDHLSDEISHLTDHAVALDASFNKFGYHAQMRTIEDTESASLSHSDTGSSQQRYLDRSLQPLRFWRTPTIRQYFHKGILWRSPDSGEVGSFELFTDLIYVGVIDIIGETAVTHASAETFLHFVIIFILAYKIWSDLTVTVNWFEVQDCVGRIGILFVLCCLYGFNSNVEHFFVETYTAGIAFFLTQRFFLMAFYTITSFCVKMIRGNLLLNVFVALVASALYIASVHIEYPYNLVTLWLGIFVDFAGPVLSLIMIRRVMNNKIGVSEKLYAAFEFIPAINIEHRCERTSAFTTLVFGYSVLKSLYQSRAHVGVNAFLGKGILALIQAFAIMWLYFDIDGWAVHVHAIRRHWVSSIVWITAHLPLAGSFILASSTLSQLVLAHDCANANVEDLTEVYAATSAETVEQPLRWFYCAGLSVTLLSMTAISASHIHKKIKTPRLTKTVRLAIRLCIALVLLLLPLAHHLNSIQLVSITTSLFVFVLTIDVFGNSCEGEKFWSGGWCKDADSRCKYTAKLKMSKKRKAELQKKLVEGKEVGLSDVLRRSDSVDSQATTLDVGEQWHGSHL